MPVTPKVSNVRRLRETSFRWQFPDRTLHVVDIPRAPEGGDVLAIQSGWRLAVREFARNRLAVTGVAGPKASLIAAPPRTSAALVSRPWIPGTYLGPRFQASPRPVAGIQAVAD